MVLSAGGNEPLKSAAIKLIGCILVSVALFGSDGCLKMLPNSGVRAISISHIDDSGETLLLQTGDDQVIRTIVSAIESRREEPMIFAPEYIVRLEQLDGTTTWVGVLGTALKIDGKTYTSSTDVGAQIKAILSRAPSTGSHPNTHAAQLAVAPERARRVTLASAGAVARAR
jgi:hypothetical protein